MELMPWGLEVLTADGRVLFNADNRLIRVLTVANVGQGGTFTDLNNLTDVTAHLLINASLGDKAAPTYSHNGSQVTWGWGNIPTEHRDPSAVATLLVL